MMCWEVDKSHFKMHINFYLTLRLIVSFFCNLPPFPSFSYTTTLTHTYVHVRTMYIHFNVQKNTRYSSKVRQVVGLLQSARLCTYMYMYVNTGNMNNVYGLINHKDKSHRVSIIYVTVHEKIDHFTQLLKCRYG